MRHLHTLALALVAQLSFAHAAQAAPMLSGQSFNFAGLKNVQVYADRFNFFDALSQVDADPGPIVVTSSNSATFPFFASGLIADFGRTQVAELGNGMGTYAGALSFTTLPTVVFVAQTINRYGSGSVTGDDFTSSATYNLKGYVFDDLNLDGAVSAGEIAYRYSENLTVSYTVGANTAIQNINSPQGQSGSFAGSVVIGAALVNNVPEPGSMALMGLGLLGFGAGSARRRKA